MLVVDTREDQVIPKMLKEKGADFKLDMLNFGDYLVLGVEEKFVIERKTPLDLLLSAEHERIWDQLKGLEKFDGYKKILLLEGEFSKEYILTHYSIEFLWYQAKYHLKDFDRSYNRYMGILTAIAKSWNVNIISMQDKNATVQFLMTLNAKVGEPQSDVAYVSTVPKKGRRGSDQESIDVLAAIDGIGGEKARNLLKEFGTLKKIFGATEQKLTGVVGEKIAKHIVELRGSQFGNEQGNQD